VPSPQVRRFTIVAPDNARVMHAAIAPDGRVVAFVSADRIWLRRLDEVDAHEIKGTGGARGVSWSPDSQFIAFESRGQLMKVAISGGEPAVICPVPQAFSPSAGVAWLDDGRIVFTTGGSGLLEVSAQGGTARSFLEPGRPREIDFHDVTALPGGRGVLFVPHVERNQNTIELFDGRSRRVVYTSTRTVHDPVYAPSGHLLFLQDASVWAVPFSLADAKAVGEPFVVATRAAHATVSADGTLVVEPGSSLADAQLAWVDRDGRVLEAVGPRGHVLVGSRLSPDGSRLAGAIEAAGNLDLWTLDVNTGAEMRLTFEAEDDRGPAWSADGKTIVYGCGSNICARAADGSGGRHVLLQEAGGPALSPDGRALVFSRSAATTGPDLWTVPFTGTAPSVVEAAAKPLVVADGPQRSPVFSPDGRYVSYESFTAPTWSGFVTAFPSGDGRWEVAKEVGSGGASVRWTVKGDRLYWLDRAYGLVEMDVSTVPSFRVRGTRQLGLIAAGVMSATTFQPSLDGAKFLVTLTNAAPGTESRVVVIENWTASRR
jgi:WD40 repeat protein